MNKEEKEVYYWLMSNPGYLKRSALSIKKSSFKKKKLQDVYNALIKARQDSKNGVKILNKSKQVKFSNKTDIKKLNKLPKNTLLKRNESIKKSIKKITIEAVNSRPLNGLEAEELISTQESKKSLKQKKIRRLFFDIETSPNVMYSWRSGYKLNLGPEMILKERAVICLCYKWEGNSKVHSLTWNKGDDKQLLIDFISIMKTADEVVGHNSDQFDIKWLRTRCLYHSIPMLPSYKSIDTYKWAKKYFNLNSNKLDYIGQFTGVGKKMDHGGFGLWRAILEDNNPKAMDKMVKYCKVDVIRLSQIFDKMFPYCEPKTHLGVLLGHDRDSCPSCGSTNTKRNGVRINAKGLKTQAYQCNSCGKNHSIPKTIADKLKK